MSQLIHRGVYTGLYDTESQTQMLVAPQPWGCGDCGELENHHPESPELMPRLECGQLTTGQFSNVVRCLTSWTTW